GLSDRSPITRTDPASMEAPDRRLAHRPGEQRTDRGGQQFDQEGEARRLRVHQFPELPDPLTALRRKAQLGSAQNDQTGCHSEYRQTPLKSEEPYYVSSPHLTAERWA